MTAWRRVLASPGCRLELTTDDARIAAAMEERLGAFLENGASDARLDLVAATLPGAKWDSDLLGRLDGRRLLVEQSGGQGAFDLHARSGRLEISTVPEWFHIYVENALRMILVELAEQTGIRICHSAAIADPQSGGAFLFFGPSGAGKTTSMEMALARGMRPINDDLVFVGIDEDDRVFAQGCAFHGKTKVRDFAHGRFPVKGLYRLQQADRHHATPLPLAEAVRELSRSLVPWRSRTRAEQEKVFDFAHAVCRRVPAFRLQFKKDPAFLEAARDGLR